MKILYFDMEFADGKVPGSVFSFGYTVTDEDFRVLTPPTDIVINPESTWNDYVAQKILAYPMEEIEAAPAFPAVYDRIKALFDDCDMAVGFALGNDTTALRKDCDRYRLPYIPYFWFDLEPLCKLMEDHAGVRGLGNCVSAWCGREAEHRHRSDGDAQATMMLLEAICRSRHATPEMLFDAYPECCGEGIPVAPKKKPQPHKSNRRRHNHHRRGGKKPQNANA